MSAQGRPANQEKEVKTSVGVEFFAVAEVGNGSPADQLHDEVGAALLALPAIEDLGDVRVVHHRESLTLGLEAGHHLTGVHSGLENFNGDAAADRRGLLGHEDGAEAAFADALEDLIQPAGAEGGAFQWIAPGRPGLARCRISGQRIGLQPVD